jgi:phosphatidylserine/phosphatidylglycerophosphate/cardiolipin synthase-like enzyme
MSWRIALLVVAACSPTISGDDDDDAAAFSPIGHSVVEALRADHAAFRGITWDLATDNAFDTDWLIQTPVNWGQPAGVLVVTAPCTGDAACDADFGLLACSVQTDCHFGGICSPVAATVKRPGDAARKLCVGHSDTMYDRIYGLVSQARTSVEITSLSPPDGRFEAALRNAITYLSYTGAPVRVRFLYGAIIGAQTAGVEPTPDQVLQSLTRDLNPSSPIRVGIAANRSSVVSWNHAKIISVDGETAIVGGHNMWTQHYLQQSPVHDISLQISGSAAAHAMRFADYLWRHTCTPPPGLDASATIAGLPGRDAACDESAPLPIATGHGSTRTVTVARLGTLGTDEASDDALVALVDAAQSKIRLSLQDIGPISAGAAWPEPYLRALVSALARGVDVELVLSNLNSLPGGLTTGSEGYSNGWTAADVVAKVTAYGGAHPEVAGADMAMLCSRFHATTLRFGPDDAWPDGTSFANHAKLAIVDDQAFYMGSQNWYPANLYELGFVVDDADATRELVDAYYTKLWAASSREIASCTP